MKKIKNTKTVILAAFVVVGSLFASCSSDDDNGSNDTKEASIVGKWKVATSVEETFVDNKSQGKKSITIDDQNYRIYTFETDGTFIDFEEHEKENGPLTDLGTYKINEDKLILSYDPEDVDDFEEYVFSLKDDTLVLITTEEVPSTKTKYIITETFKRQ